MPWAKLHTDILGDPKLMRAARKGAKGLEYLPWLIAFAKEADDNGRLSIGEEPADPVDLAQLIPGATPKSIRNCLSSLENIGVLRRDSSNFLCFSAWEARSGTKPSDAPSAIAERVARHRAAKSLQQHDSGNASNALQGVTGNATEKRREEERRTEEKRGERNGAGAPSPKRELPAWIPRFRAHWQEHVGAATPAELRRWIGPLLETYDEPLLMLAVEEYGAATAGKATGVMFFAKGVVGWVAKAKDDGELVRDGWLTTEGERATRPGALR